MYINTIGKIFKGDLPLQNTGVIQNGLRLTNYTRYTRNANIFRTYIEIDRNQANILNLSYFKTISVNKYQNSNLTTEQLGYVNLLNQNQKLDIESYIPNQLNEKYKLINNNILGRSFVLSDGISKLNIENFSQRKIYNYTFGSTLNNQLQFQRYQDIFFECYAPINSPKVRNLTEYDLYVYAFNKNNEIIDVKKILNFDTSNITWSIDNRTTLLNIDDIDFNRLFSITFNTQTYNNVIRKFNLNLTDYCKQQKNILKFIPVESVTIQENDYVIENELNNISIDTIFNENDSYEFTCQADLNIKNIPFNIDYKLFFKIRGMNSFYIQNISNIITSQNSINLINQFDNLKRYFSCKAEFLTNKNVIKLNLKLLKEAFNNLSFNPVLSNICINSIENEFIDKVYTFEPGNFDIPNLNLKNNLLKNIVINNFNELQNEYLIYLYPSISKYNDIIFKFQQDYEEYIISFPIDKIYFETDYLQSLIIKNNVDQILNEYSNLDIEYNLQIRNFKNTNTNLDRFISLKYDNIFLPDIQSNIQNLSDNFQNNVFVIVKKNIIQDKIYDEYNKIIKNNTDKEKYYLFNNDILKNINFQFDTDLVINLKFNDNQALYDLFFKEYPDDISINHHTKYEFEAKIFIIPIGFFSIDSKWSTLNRLKELLMLNSPNSFIPSKQKIDYFYTVLNNINNNQFDLISQKQLFDLYEEYCLNNSLAKNEIIILKENIQTNNNLLFKKYTNELINNSGQKKYTINIEFESILNNIGTNELISILTTKLKNLVNNIYFKSNKNYIELQTILVNYNNNEFISELNNNISLEFSINNNIISIKINININDVLNIYFTKLYNRSELHFSPYQKGFLKENVFLNLSFNDINTKLFKIDFKDADSKYIPLDIYSILN